MHLRTLLPLVLLVAAVPASADEPVRVYTNADLDRLAPIPTQPAEPLSDEERDRRAALVDAMLDRAYGRIDADRQYEIESRRLEVEAQGFEALDLRPSYSIPYYPYVAHGPLHDRPGPAPLSRLWERPNAHLFRPITPIHARPYQNNLLRLEARRAAPGQAPPRPAKPGR